MNIELLDRLPPHAMESEKQVLGSILLMPKCLGEVADILAPADFYVDAHERIFATFLAFDSERKPIDVALLLERFRADSNLEAIGGEAYLAEILHSAPTASHAVYHAKIVREKAIVRGVIHAATETLRDAYEADVESQALLDHAEQRLQEVGARREVKHATAMELAGEVSDYIDQAMQGRGLGLETGFYEFDQKAGGLFPGEFVVLAARPGIGKSALASQIADYVSAGGNLVYIVSLEMSGRELAMRSVCRDAEVNSRAIRTGRVRQEGLSALTDKIALYSRRNLIMDRGLDMTVETLARRVRRLVPKGLKLVVLDYLTLLTPSDKRAPRHEQVAYQSRCLKNLAREIQVPVLVLCQLNRTATEDSGRPQLQHLKESGALEQDPDTVLFIHRPQDGILIPDTTLGAKKGAKVKADWPAELIVAKQRNGATGYLKLDWQPEYTRFSCYGHQTEPDDVLAEYGATQGDW